MKDKDKSKKYLQKLAKQIYEIETNSGDNPQDAEFRMQEIVSKLSIEDMLYIDTYLQKKFFDK